MAQFLGFGNAQDGATVTLSGTETPIDSSAATSGSNLTATNASFAAGQLVLIHQTQGPTHGGWEVNQVKTYSTGTITPSVPLVNTYSTSSGNAHQVRVIPQYGTVTVSGTFTAKAFNGTTGGLLTYVAAASTITGNINADGCGFRGGTGNFSNSSSQYGEGGPGVAATASNNNANGNGGGKGGDTNSGSIGAGGGGGLGSTGGTPGVQGGTFPGTGGSTDGSSDLTVLVFGGGGGGGMSNFASSSGNANGGAGGGAILIMSAAINVSGGTITAKGLNGGTATDNGSRQFGGGGGSGGSIFIKTTGYANSGAITSTGGIGGNQGYAFPGQIGGNGGVGITRVECCNSTDSATYNPTASIVIGGFSWCSVYSQMI